jgi:hypothetical protein
VARVFAVGCERETEAHDERPVDPGPVEQLELVDEEPGLGLFIPGIYRPHPRPDERPQDRYCHSQHGQSCRVEGAEKFRVVGVPAGSEAELGDGDGLPRGLEFADLGQVLAGGWGLLTVVIDAGNVEVVPVDALERESAAADRAAVDAAYRGCGLREECAQRALPGSDDLAEAGQAAALYEAAARHDAAHKEGELVADAEGQPVRPAPEQGSAAAAASVS